MDVNTSKKLQKKKRTCSLNEIFFREKVEHNVKEFSDSLPMILASSVLSSGKKKYDTIVEYSLRTGSVHFIKHVPMRLTRSRLSCPAISRDSTTMGNIHLHNMSQRRESFLYKYEVDSSISPEKFSRQTSVTSTECNSSDCVEDIIVTPFAQILAVLHRIRTNVNEMTALTAVSTDSTMQHHSQPPKEDNATNNNRNVYRSRETMYMLDWCLENLESIQTDRSVSSLATVKFKKMLNFELHQYDDETSTNQQISDYICNTFLDDRLEMEENYSETASACSRHCSTEDGLNSTKDCCDIDNLSNLEVPHPQYLEINKILEVSLDKWGLDLFEIHDISNNVLTLITHAIFKSRQIITLFKIPNETLVNFLLKVEETYKKVPYHNSIHAADVIQTAHVMLKSNALQNVFTDLEIFSVLFACVIHDVDHPGLTNQYLINTSDPLATLYNDQSVLENHHLATSFSILKEKKYDILINLSKQEKSTFRKLVIDMVLATDMSHHMNLLADLKTMVETKKVSGSGLLDMDKYNDRATIIQNMVHCADLSNPTKPIVIYEEWVNRIMEEFFLQGDKEKERGLDLSAMCDRENAAIERTQIGFIDYIVHPLWESWCELVHPDAQNILDALAENRKFFCMKICTTQTIAEVDSNEDDYDSKIEDS